MIIVKIIGGLGNQMFQYALGLSLAKKNNSVCKLDLSGFSNYKLHNYSLNHFTIHATQATDVEINQLAKSQKPIIKIVNKIFGVPKNSAKNTLITEQDFSFNEHVLNLRGDYYLDGYWQSEKYFINCQNLIRNEFKVKSEPDKKNIDSSHKINNSDSVSIHIRHGDYLTNTHTKTVHGVLPLSYYFQAITLIKKRVTNPTFFVFSDDIEWAKQNLNKEKSIFFVSHNNADSNYEDLRLMSSCKHNIIANSSFSWWGAWLNNNLDKIVIAPRKWFGDSSKNTKDLLPKSWIKI